jgi:hypothetical protein
MVQQTSAAAVRELKERWTLSPSCPSMKHQKVLVGDSNTFIYKIKSEFRKGLFRLKFSLYLLYLVNRTKSIYLKTKMFLTTLIAGRQVYSPCLVFLGGRHGPHAYMLLAGERTCTRFPVSDFVLVQ